MARSTDQSADDERRIAGAVVVLAKRHPLLAVLLALLLANGASIANLAKSAIGVSAVEDRVAKLEEVLVGNSESPGVVVKLGDLKAGQDELRKSLSGVVRQLQAVQRTLSPKGVTSHEITVEDPLSFGRVLSPPGVAGL